MRSQLGNNFEQLSRVPIGAWTPASLGSSLKLWISADSGTYSDAGTTPSVADGVVQQWNDRSGNGYNLSGAGGVRPLLKTNILNSLPAVRFDATDDRLTCASLTKGTIGTACWIASVVIPRSVASELDYYGWNNNTDYSPNYVQWVCGITSAGKLRSNGYDGTTKEALFTNASSADTAYSVLNVFNGTNVSIYKSGTLQQQSAAGTPNINSAVTFKVGKQFYASNADICELMVVSGTPSAGDISNVAAYLLSRWGV